MSKSKSSCSIELAIIVAINIKGFPYIFKIGLLILNLKLIYIGSPLETSRIIP